MSDIQTYYCGICQHTVQLVSSVEDDLVASRCANCGCLFNYKPYFPDQYFKIIIAGSREFKDYKKLSLYCEQTIESLREDDREIEIVSGTARGADRMGERYARERGYHIKPFPAPWNDVEGKPPEEISNRLGRPYWTKAGHFRNRKMAEYADALILFWDGKSRGSEDMLKHAKQLRLTIDICRI